MFGQIDIYPDNISGDIFLKDHQISRCFRSEAVRQNVIQRILTIKEEWFLNLEQGLPWFTELHGMNVPLPLVRARLVESILSTPGVEALLSIRVFVIRDRHLGVEFEYRDIYGDMKRIEL